MDAALTLMRPAGRPKMAATIIPSASRSIAKREAFFNMCRSLSHRELVLLANGLAISVRTVERWYYGELMPDEDMRDDIMDWITNGKPVHKLYSCDSINPLY